MNIEQARFNMIEQQIRPWDVLDQDVLTLLTVVKREAFVPQAYRALAFTDCEIPLPDSGKTGECMLTPKVEARIMQELLIQKHENVLEIGAGSGYMAALIAYKARHVTTIEIDPALKDFAQSNLAANGVSNAEVLLGDGIALAAEKAANYDVIVISGSVPVIPESLLAQIKVGGRMFIIVGSQPAMTAQIITRNSEVEYSTVGLFETVAKPLRNVPTPSTFKF